MSERSDIGFIGGLSHAGRNGVFVMPLHSRFQYTKSLPDGQAAAPDRFFAANKSYFFFDDRIACLGSDIELPDSPFHVRTILFQKRLKTPATPIQIDAQEVTALPFAVTLAPDRPHTLLDTQCTGYYIPAGQSVTVVREHQTSRDGHDRNDTAGDAATAWFDHGANPTEARYAYVVLPDTSQPELEAFAAAMAGADGQAPIQVWRQDSQAHIVLDRHTRNWGCVFYAAQELPRPEPERHSLWKRLRGLLSGAAAPQRLPILAVSQPCLVMLEQTGADTLLVSIGDPDIRADKGPGAASTVRVTLDGAWRLAEAVPHCQAELTGDGSTVLTVTCTEGKSYTMNLAR
jgi:chondroitin-sulfate-ABC endolyase/exolyase